MYRKKIFIFISVIPGLLISCEHFPRNKTHPEIAKADIIRGHALAANYCQSCHVLPDPSLLDTKTWEKGVLPAMGPRLGIFSWNFERYPSFRYDKNLDSNFYPQKPLVQLGEWKNIMDYYLACSPDTLIADNATNNTIREELPIFQIKAPFFTNTPPAICYLKIVESTSGNFLIISDAIEQKLYKLNSNFEVLDSVKTDGAVVDLESSDAGWISCHIGIFNPNNGKYGSARNIIFNSKGKLEQSADALFNGLARPVQVIAADLNTDGKKDLVVCEFGFQEGA